MNRTCSTCKHYLGGSACGYNSERECADDDARPLWEPRTVFRDYVEAAYYRDDLQPDHFHAHPEDGKVIANYNPVNE